MPRTARLVIPDMALHVVQRGHDRADCFFKEGDYVSYLVALGTYAARFECTVHAYCLMTNHVHLLITPRETTGRALLMKHLSQRHAKRINARRGRSGTLWEGRPYSGIVANDEYAVACYRYIELNPVRAAMVNHPSACRWSSHAANTRAGLHSFLRPHPSFLALATEDERRATYGGHRMGEPRKPRGRQRRLATRENGDCHQLEMVTVTN